ncbi:hypothetical protein Tco_0881703 [Tanacetum coccineum]
MTKDYDEVHYGSLPKTILIYLRDNFLSFVLKAYGATSATGAELVKRCGYIFILHLVFTFPDELRTPLRVPAYFDNRNMTLLQTLDLTVHDLDRAWEPTPAPNTESSIKTSLRLLIHTMKRKRGRHEELNLWKKLKDKKILTLHAVSGSLEPTFTGLKKKKMKQVQTNLLDEEKENDDEVVDDPVGDD